MLCIYLVMPMICQIASFRNHIPWISWIDGSVVKQQCHKPCHKPPKWLGMLTIHKPIPPIKIRWNWGWINTYENTIFSGMNIHLPAILGFTRGTRFWHTAKLGMVKMALFYPHRIPETWRWHQVELQKTLRATSPARCQVVMNATARCASCNSLGFWASFQQLPSGNLT